MSDRSFFLAYSRDSVAFLLMDYAVNRSEVRPSFLAFSFPWEGLAYSRFINNLYEMNRTLINSYIDLIID